MEQPTILLTGGTGFLGSNLLKKLLLKKFKIILLKRSFSDVTRIKEQLSEITAYDIDRTTIEEIAENEKADLVIHCATDYGRKNISPDKVIDANLKFPLQLLANSKRLGCSCFINTDTIIDKRINYYSLSKKQFREWLKLYSGELTAVNVKLEHFFGPFDDRTKFISYVIDQLQKKVEHIDFTPGEQKRDFIYIDDVVNAFLLIIDDIVNLRKCFKEYNIATGQQLLIREAVLMIRDAMHNTATSLNFGALPYRKNELMSSDINIDKIKKTGWFPEYDFARGLKRTLSLEGLL